MFPAPLRRLICCCWAVACLLPAQGHAQPVPEYELKAAFVYNFALFTEWPEESTNEGSTLNLCVSHRSPMRVPLANLREKPLRGKRVAVRYLSTFDNLRACHVLFLDGNDREHWRLVRKGLASTSILTISDDEEIGREGSIIAMSMERSRIVFDIDLQAARQAHLALSSKLLRLARSTR